MTEASPLSDGGANMMEASPLEGLNIMEASPLEGLI